LRESLRAAIKVPNVIEFIVVDDEGRDIVRKKIVTGGR
jgi:hypothetical protein